jgi:predicted alpha/beta superfamily hydrolase
LGTHVRELRSSAVGQDYQISVLLPDSYATSQARYPVLYLLDGNVMMAVCGVMAPFMTLDKVVPELIVVGVGNPMRTSDEWGAHRGRDYTPVAAADWPGSGGGPQFFRFLRDELLPFVDAEYRTDPGDRVLYGYSLGGLMVLYALLQQPALFRRYVAGSPAAFYGARAIFACEGEYARSHTALPARVFMEVGTLEDRDDHEFCQAILDFAATLRGRNYAGLDLTLTVLDGETHMTGWPRSFTLGLKAVYR